MKRIYCEENYKKARELEEKKTSTKEEIIYFKEEDLKHIKEGYTNTDLEELFNTPISVEKRSLLEYVEEQRHPIPYILLEYENKYFLTFREKGGGEVRLQGLLGLLGGHISKEDIVYKDNLSKIDLLKTVGNGMFRELSEEVGLDDEMINYIYYRGMIKINNVGSVENDHLGLIFRIGINTDNIKTLEEDTLSGKWFTEQEILTEMERGNLENWSKLIFEKICKKY